MLFRAIVASLAAATAVLGAAVPEAAVERFNPTTKPLPTPVYDIQEEPLTNAERLRRGLAPLAPKVRAKRLAAMHAPGPVAPVPSAAPSGTPDTDPGMIFEGIVQVADPDTNEVLGYVSNKLTLLGQLGVDKNYRNPLEVTFKTARASQKAGSIEITSGDGRSGKYFGAVVSEWTRNGIFGKGKDKFAYLTRTGETKTGHGPMNVANAILSTLGLKLKATSSIWTANSITRALEATWTNPDGTPLETTVFYYKKFNALALSADPEIFQAEHPSARPVKLSIISKPFY